MMKEATTTALSAKVLSFLCTKITPQTKKEEGASDPCVDYSQVPFPNYKYTKLELVTLGTGRSFLKFDVDVTLLANISHNTADRVLTFTGKTTSTLFDPQGLSEGESAMQVAQRVEDTYRIVNIYRTSRYKPDQDQCQRAAEQFGLPGSAMQWCACAGGVTRFF